MKTTRQRCGTVGGSGRLGALGCLALALAASGGAEAKPNCDAPNPPPACSGGDGGTPPPSPTQSLQRPLMGGFGDFYDYRIYVDVQAQPADASRVASMTVQSGATLNGPWVNWKVRQPYTSAQSFGRVALDYTDPSATRCFRAQVFASNGDYSPWSVAKCIRPVAPATNVSLRFARTSATIGWNDNSAFDDSYVIYFRHATSSQWSMMHVLGNQGLLGARQATIPNWSPFDRLCVTLWPIEKLPGVDFSSASGYLSDSTPMNPSIWRTPEVCGDIGF